MLPKKLLKSEDVYYRVDKPLSVREALEVLARIEARDPRALDELTCGDEIGLMCLKHYQSMPNKMFANEWGVAKAEGFNNPECVIVPGSKGSVEWKEVLDANMIPIAHSHPFHRASPSTTRALADKGVLWGHINGDLQAQDAKARLLVFPSRGDVAFCAAQKLAVHIVKTPYCVVYGGSDNNNSNEETERIPWVMNPDNLMKNQRFDPLSFRLFDVKEWTSDGIKTIYKTSIVALFGDRDVWRKHDLYVEIQSPADMTAGLVF